MKRALPSEKKLNFFDGQVTKHDLLEEKMKTNFITAIEFKTVYHFNEKCCDE